jgi:hypothetical protein
VTGLRATRLAQVSVPASADKSVSLGHQAYSAARNGLLKMYWGSDDPRLKEHVKRLLIEREGPLTEVPPWFAPLN